VLSLWLAYLLRFDFRPEPEHLRNFSFIALSLVAVKLLALTLLGQFGSLLSYFGLPDIWKIFLAMLLAAFVALTLWLWQGVAYAPPRAVIITDLILSFIALSSMRTAFRLMREGYFGHRRNGSARKRVAVIGAGDVGASLVRDFQLRRGLGMNPIAFFDDDHKKWGTSIHGVAVAGAPETLPAYLRRSVIDEIIIAMPSATGRRIREIVILLNQLKLRFEIVPSYEQLISGKVRTSHVRPVEIQDLLGREQVELESERIRELVQDKAVLVTGAGGTIGGELCRQIAGLAPRQVLMVERSEFLLFQIEQELQVAGFGSEIVPLVADVLDSTRMEGIMQRFRPAVIFHAAAHKHVPMMERQPAEAFRNNSIGTRQLADLALTHRVELFVLISTDKAINPTNVMGVTKRIAELYLQALQRHGQGVTRFMAVRFGNVLGSSGSVIPTFKRQIAAGGPVTVTHPEVTRYFMTVTEAVGLVLQSSTLGQGGEIFVLDMGTPMKIVDLARQLIELSGLEPDTDVEIRFTGLRPGEKLYEELIHSSENHTLTSHPKIMKFLSEPRLLEELRAALSDLHANVAGMEADRIKTSLNILVPEYKPQFGSQ
jgi:FlaA1/EpsC-like NDP-sugar epimerase